MDESEGQNEVLHMLLEMLKYHNAQLSVLDDTKELRKELLGDNLVAIRILENILYGKHERGLN